MILSGDIRLPSPVEEIDLPIFREKNIKVFVKREDLIHPLLSGNKWRKLKYNIDHYTSNGYSRMITFGGPFSNHLYAFASACKIFSIAGTAFVRGDGFDANNPTLNHLKECGIEMIFLDREAYKLKQQAKKAMEYLKSGNVFILPEGGSNKLGMKGVKEMMEEVHSLKPSPDVILVCAGTGCTASGIIDSTNIKVEVYPALKGSFMTDLIKQHVNGVRENFECIEGYHFGGYAKVNEELVEFIVAFRKDTGIPLDTVYTGKMFYGMLERIKNDTYAKGSVLLAIHTGGLQGIEGFNSRFGSKFRL